MTSPDKHLKNVNAVPIIITRIRQNRGIVRFCLLFFLYVTLILLLIHVLKTKTNILTLISLKVAQLSSCILNLFGMNTESVNSIVFGPKSRIAVDITYKCTSIIQIAFFSAGVFAYSCKLSKKLIGMIAGIPLIFSINLVRIVSLFLIGVIAFPFFDFAHKVIGELLMIIVTLLTWLFWLKRMSPPEAKSSEA